MSDYHSGQVFQKLRLNIERLKADKQELDSQLNIDRNDLSNVEASMAELNRQLDSRMGIIRQKERKLMEIEKAINQTEKSYDIIVDTTQKLSTALESEASHIRNMVRK